MPLGAFDVDPDFLKAPGQVAISSRKKAPSRVNPPSEGFIRKEDFQGATRSHDSDDFDRFNGDSETEKCVEDVVHLFFGVFLFHLFHREFNNVGGRLDHVNVAEGEGAVGVVDGFPFELELFEGQGDEEVFIEVVKEAVRHVVLGVLDLRADLL